jgi:hypothetical protein
MDRRISFRSVLATVGFAVSGVLFFFSIIGVFGLPLAIGSLLLFLVVAEVSFYRGAQEID